jgi:hypothetical protein
MQVEEAALRTGMHLLVIVESSQSTSGYNP